MKFKINYLCPNLESRRCLMSILLLHQNLLVYRPTYPTKNDERIQSKLWCIQPSIIQWEHQWGYIEAMPPKILPSWSEGQILVENGRHNSSGQYSEYMWADPLNRCQSVWKCDHQNIKGIDCKQKVNVLRILWNSLHFFEYFIPQGH